MICQPVAEEERIYQSIHEFETQLHPLIGKCDKIIHDQKRCKCNFINVLYKEIDKLRTFRKKHIDECEQNFSTRDIEECLSAEVCCDNCRDNNRFKLEKEFGKFHTIFTSHKCLKNWDGTAKAMEAAGAYEIFRLIIENTDAFHYSIVKDDDGTMTASLAPRLMIKEEYENKTYHPWCMIKNESGETEEKKTYFEPKAYALGNKCGKQEPDSDYIEFFDLADPGHRLRNFGKELKK